MENKVVLHPHFKKEIDRITQKAVREVLKQYNIDTETVKIIDKEY